MIRNWRVDTVPWWAKPIFVLLTNIFALIGYTYIWTLHLTCKIKIIGLENCHPDQQYIYCIWHSNVSPSFPVLVRLDRPHIWMNHPAAYMRPLHIVLGWMGVERLILGSTGNDGVAAAQELTQILKRGVHSTLILPDGPSGPRGHLYKGVLHISQNSGVPILPIRVKTSKSLWTNTWDKKRYPYPFSTIQFEYMKPISVTPESFEQSYQMLKERMGPLPDADEKL